MSLQVWLPLTKDLHNQGNHSAKISVNTNITYESTGGKFGGCYGFNGSSSYILSDSSPFSNSTNDWSYACWFKPINSHQGCLFSDRTGVGTTGITLFYYDGGILFDDGDRWSFTPSQTITVGQWNHLTFVRKKGVGKYFYLNGQLINSTTATQTATSVSTRFSIGSSQDSTNSTSGNYLYGYLNDVRIYNHALSTQEISTIAKGLIIHYPLNHQVLGQLNLLHNSNFLQGSNGMEGYTATSSTCTKQTNCMKVVSTSASGGFYTSNFDSITTGDITTFSADVKADSNMTIYIGTDGSGNGSCQAYTIGTSWKRISISKAKTTNNPNLRIYGNGTFYTKNLKYELGSIATPWSPHLSDNLTTVMDLNSTIEYDGSGYQNNGTKIGTFTWSSDVPNLYDISTLFGSNKKITLANPSTTEVKTIAFWAKTNSATEQIAFVDNMSLMSFGFFSGHLLVSYGGNCNMCYPISTITLNNWHHIVLIKESSSIIRLYVDGVSQTAESYTNYWSISTSNLLEIGSRNNGYPWRGPISDFRMYTTILTAKDIKSLYQNSAYIDDNNVIYGKIR